ncbi:MAG: NERD domain-containing protein [Bacilli bacterium]|jgi:hypothetical protein
MPTVKDYFIILVSLIALAIIVWLLYKPIKRLIYTKRYKFIYYRKINKVAHYEDFYLINRFRLIKDKNNLITIDHILFGNKWIYLLQDYYFRGILSGKEEDDSWHLDNGKQKRFITNPLKDNAKFVRLLSKNTQIDENMFITIGVYNDDLILKRVGETLNNNYLTNIKQLPKLIKALEKREVDTLNEEELEQVVLDLSKLNSSLDKKDERQKRSKK